METVAGETAVRLGRGYLNGTTRAQAYGLLFVSAAIGAASGVAGTVYVIKKRYILERKPVIHDVRI